jgi:hypothetical protein
VAGQPARKEPGLASDGTRSPHALREVRSQGPALHARAADRRCAPLEENPGPAFAGRTKVRSVLAGRASRAPEPGSLPQGHGLRDRRQPVLSPKETSVRFPRVHRGNGRRVGPDPQLPETGPRRKIANAARREGRATRSPSQRRDVRKARRTAAAKIGLDRNRVAPSLGDLSLVAPDRVAPGLVVRSLEGRVAPRDQPPPEVGLEAVVRHFPAGRIQPAARKATGLSKREDRGQEEGQDFPVQNFPGREESHPARGRRKGAASARLGRNPAPSDPAIVFPSVLLLVLRRAERNGRGRDLQSVPHGVEIGLPDGRPGAPAARPKDPTIRGNRFRPVPAREGGPAALVAREVPAPLVRGIPDPVRRRIGSRDPSPASHRARGRKHELDSFSGGH